MPVTIISMDFYWSIYVFLDVNNKILPQQKCTNLLFWDSQQSMARRQLSLNEKTWIVKHMYRLEYPSNWFFLVELSERYRV